ncbi:Ribosomal protein S12/S23 family protein (apicoplast) [Theileria parva strain Muguga]|uniref:Ribosomal protein S12, putative n=1 Tax=Theileria parva TaxID=5875 RepID=Q4MYA6_THEPA|nr:Ribosomal protein S12/S23 family protein [Theileria parva strain Muguga]|eukprot:XP_762686.1 ribosomal protein S12 (apicoplast) [Theileria parva strain Muguga]
MTTLNQSIKRKKQNKKKITVLNHNPQLEGFLCSIISMSPKKPNSAKRKVGIIELKNNKKIKAYIPGERSVVRDKTRVLIRGGNTRDLPGVNHKIVLNMMNCREDKPRHNKRSKYGVKKIKAKKR